jgi:hypothetical protein
MTGNTTHRTLEFSGDSSAKGRNGYFSLCSLQIAAVPGRCIRIEGYPRLIGDNPPLVLDLDVDDAVILYDALTEQLRALGIKR